MKTLFYISTIIILLSVISFAQVKDSISAKKSSEQTQVEEKKSKQNSEQSQSELKDRRGFIDENGDGIDDRKVENRKGKNRKTDRFVDKDGDGINDNRARGMNWGGKGNRSGFGRHGR